MHATLGRLSSGGGGSPPTVSYQRVSRSNYAPAGGGRPSSLVNPVQHFTSDYDGLTTPQHKPAAGGATWRSQVDQAKSFWQTIAEEAAAAAQAAQARRAYASLQKTALAAEAAQAAVVVITGRLDGVAPGFAAGGGGGGGVPAGGGFGAGGYSTASGSVKAAGSCGAAGGGEGPMRAHLANRQVRRPVLA